MGAVGGVFRRVRVVGVARLGVTRVRMGVSGSQRVVREEPGKTSQGGLQREWGTKLGVGLRNQFHQASPVRQDEF